MDFAEILRDEMDSQGIIAKELAARSGVNVNTLNHYLSGQKSMPPADTAVKIAKVLELPVEYLVTGEVPPYHIDISKYITFRKLLDDLAILPEEVLIPFKIMVQTVADLVRKKTGK
jgi:transcriptional regulator with XRE-family HTH domain